MANTCHNELVFRGNSKETVSFSWELVYVGRVFTFDDALRFSRKALALLYVGPELPDDALRFLGNLVTTLYVYRVSFDESLRISGIQVG